MFWQPMMGTGRGRPPCCSQELSGRQPHPPLHTLVNSGAQAQGPLSHPGPSLSCPPVCEEGVGWAWPGVELLFRRQHVVWSAGGSEQVLHACRGTEPVAFSYVNHNVCSCSRRLGATTARAVHSQRAGRRRSSPRPAPCHTRITLALLPPCSGYGALSVLNPEPPACGPAALEETDPTQRVAFGLHRSPHSFLPALSLGRAQLPF